MTMILPTPTELADRIKSELATLARKNVGLLTVRDFARLHDYIDANCLGGTEELWRGLPTTAHGAVDGPARNDLCDLMNAAHDEVDAWLKRGGLLDAVK